MAHSLLVATADYLLLQLSGRLNRKQLSQVGKYVSSDLLTAGIHSRPKKQNIRPTFTDSDLEL